MSGIFNTSVYEIESFPEALDRYKLKISKKDEEKHAEMQSKINIKHVLQADLSTDI